MDIFMLHFGTHPKYILHALSPFCTWLLYQNMNKINTFFSEISEQTHKMYEHVAIITEIWHIAKPLFLQAWATHGI